MSAGRYYCGEAEQTFSNLLRCLRDGYYETKHEHVKFEDWHRNGSFAGQANDTIPVADINQRRCGPVLHGRVAGLAYAVPIQGPSAMQ